MEAVRILWQVLTQAERRQTLRVGAFALATALVQTLAVLSILPFIALITSPDTGPGYAVSRIATRIGLDGSREAASVAAAAVLSLVLVANALGALNLRRVQMSAWNTHHYLSQRLLAVYLRLPYSWFLERHSSRLIQNLLWEVGLAIQGALVPLLTAAVRGAESLLIVLLLLWVDPVLTLGSGIAIGGAYILIFWAVRKSQVRLGKIRSATDERRYRVASEALGGVKEIKSLGAEEEFVRRFGETGPDFVHAKAWSAVVAELPRYLLEVLSLGTVLVVFLAWMLSGAMLTDVLPKLVMFGFAGYKLVPSLHQVFASLSQTRYSLESLKAIAADLAYAGEATREGATSDAPIRLERAIEFRDTTFTYPGAASPALDRVSFHIDRGEFVGVVGPTGSGKTTLVDVLLGLLRPESGEIRVDERVLEMDTMWRAWRGSLGYVPQAIFLADDSIRRNIAFGVKDEDIDEDAVRRAARLAEVDAFVTSLPQGLDTVVGERGVRLSGGQRQRIGLARALYRDPPLLVLDEATSALDGGTEAAVMQSIYGLERNRTVVVIAHRLQTVRRCDRILLLDRGRLVDEGTFDELLQKSDLFRVMARGVVV